MSEDMRCLGDKRAIYPVSAAVFAPAMPAFDNDDMPGYRFIRLGSITKRIIAFHKLFDTDRSGRDVFSDRCILRNGLAGNNN